MKTSTQSQALSHARKLGLAAVIASAGAVAVAAVALPPALVGVLPMLAVAVPFIAAGVVEGALEQGAAHTG